MKEFSVREMIKSDIELIVEYFSNSTSEFLLNMGVDKKLLPEKKKWNNDIGKELFKNNADKNNYYIIWQMNKIQIGNSNINNIIFGKEATMYLHLWNEDRRRKGIDSSFLKQTIPLYFLNFQLETLICEPYSMNPAPNKILRNAGYKFVKEYETTPGFINFYQTVNQYRLSRKVFREIYDQ